MNSNLNKLKSYSRKRLEILNILKYTQKIKKSFNYLSLLFASVGIFIFIASIIVIYMIYYTFIKPTNIIHTVNIEDIGFDAEVKVENIINIKKSLLDKYIASNFNVQKPIIISKNISNFNINDYIFSVNNHLSTAIKNCSHNIYSVKNINMPIINSLLISRVEIPFDALSKSIEISMFNIDINDIIEKAVILEQKIATVLSIDIGETIKNMQQKHRSQGMDIYVDELRMLREEALDHLRKIFVERNNAKNEYDKNYALQQQATTNLQKAIEFGNDTEAKIQSEKYIIYALQAAKAISNFKIYDRLYNDLSKSINNIRQRIEYINLQYINIVL